MVKLEVYYKVVVLGYLPLETVERFVMTSTSSHESTLCMRTTPHKMVCKTYEDIYKALLFFPRINKPPIMMPWSDDLTEIFQKMRCNVVYKYPITYQESAKLKMFLRTFKVGIEFRCFALEHDWDYQALLRRLAIDEVLEKRKFCFEEFKKKVASLEFVYNQVSVKKWENDGLKVKLPTNCVGLGKQFAVLPTTFKAPPTIDFTKPFVVNPDGARNVIQRGDLRFSDEPTEKNDEDQQKQSVRVLKIKGTTHLKMFMEQCFISMNIPVLLIDLS